MHSTALIACLGAILSIASATPAAAADGFSVADNCNGKVNDCYSNGCDGGFDHPSDTLGKCRSGQYAGCPCRKCGGKSGGAVDACNKNGCNGYQGVCQSGMYQGCSCK